VKRRIKVKTQYILGIDPGSAASGWVIYDNHNNRVIACSRDDGGRTPNEDLLTFLDYPGATSTPPEFRLLQQVGIESITLYQRADQNVHDTILWYGRFTHALEQRSIPVTLHSRRSVFNFLCPGVPGTSDSAVIAALKDKIGTPGVKKNPGPTYGVKGHSWQALGTAYLNAAVGAVAHIEVA
jgi:hypothetical protein